LAWPVSVLPAGGERQSLQQQQQLGLWVIAGFLTFLALEKMFLNSKEEGIGQVSPSPRTWTCQLHFWGGAQGLEAQGLS
jgi:zinc transporter 13